MRLEHLQEADKGLLGPVGASDSERDNNVVFYGGGGHGRNGRLRAGFGPGEGVFGGVWGFVVSAGEAVLLALGRWT